MQNFGIRAIAITVRKVIFFKTSEGGTRFGADDGGLLLNGSESARDESQSPAPSERERVAVTSVEERVAPVKEEQEKHQEEHGHGNTDGSTKIDG